ncbi:MAG: hypothetical protein E7265_08690 [Lachnospiraceae bacterium]|nr:hypothetical protein [Lachnospiraceae bacterium]
MNNTIGEVINLTDDMCELFYQQKNEEALGKMNIFLNNVVAISGSLSDEDGQKVLGVLTEALNAMEAKDYVLLADILKYDMIDVLKAV